LSSNLRPITCEYGHLVTRCHIRSRDKDGRHTIRSAIAENPMLHANLMALCFIEQELLPIDVFHCGNSGCGPSSLFWPWLWPWPDDLYMRTWPVLCRDIRNMRIQTSFKRLLNTELYGSYTHRLGH